MTAILYRYARYMGYDLSAASDLTDFRDRPVSWAEAAVKWAVGTGLMENKGIGILPPADKATRGDAVALLTRFLQGHP